MLRTALFAAAVFAASLSPAHADVFVEGRVVAVAPNFALSFGSRHRDGFRIDYEYGGERYVTYRDVYPGRVILVPPPVAVIPVGPHFGHRHWRDHDRWDDRRHWRGHRHGHGHKHGHRHHRHHD